MNKNKINNNILTFYNNSSAYTQTIPLISKILPLHNNICCCIDAQCDIIIINISTNLILTKCSNKQKPEIIYICLLSPTLNIFATSSYQTVFIWNFDSSDNKLEIIKEIYLISFTFINKIIPILNYNFFAFNSTNNLCIYHNKKDTYETYFQFENIQTPIECFIETSNSKIITVFAYEGLVIWKQEDNIWVKENELKCINPNNVSCCGNNSVIEIKDNEIAILGYDMICLVDLINVQITERFVLEKEIPICHSFEYHQLVKYHEGESIFVIRKDMVGIFDYNNRMYGEKRKMVLKVKDVHYSEENKKLIGINWEKEQIEIWN